MSKGINKVILIGNLGNDPEIRATNNGESIANLSLATSDSWTDKSGQQQERTEWHRVVLFGKLAEIAGQYLHKGSKVYICGSLRTRKWQDKQGNDKYTTEVVGREMQFLDSKPTNDRSAAAQNAGGVPVPDDFSDDEIPF